MIPRPRIYALICDPKTKSITDVELKAEHDLDWFKEGQLEEQLGSDEIHCRFMNNICVAYSSAATANNEHAITLLGSEWLDGAPSYRARTFKGPIAVFGVSEEDDQGRWQITHCPISVPWLQARIIWSAIDAVKNNEIES